MELARVHQLALPALHEPLAGWAEWFFGEREPDIPMHAGYCLGYSLASGWLQRTGATASAACAVSAADVWAEA